MYERLEATKVNYCAGIITNVDNLVTRGSSLGDISFIGNFFKYRSTTEQRRELLVFISPQIVAGGTTGP